MNGSKSAQEIAQDFEVKAKELQAEAREKQLEAKQWLEFSRQLRGRKAPGRKPKAKVK